MCLRLIMAAISVLASASFAAAAPFAYVANSGTNNVTRINMDPASGYTSATISLGTSQVPYSVAVGPSGQYVYVANQKTKDVSIIDTAQGASNVGQLVRTVPLGTSKPSGLAVNPAETRLYVANQTDNSVSVWDFTTDSTTNTEIARITLSTSPHTSPEGLALNAAGDTLYVANSATNTVSVISIDETQEPATYTKVADIPVGNFPTGLALSLDGKTLYVANMMDSSVSKIDTPTQAVTATIPVAPGYQGLTALAIGSGYLYATNFVQSLIYQVNLSNNQVVTLNNPGGQSLRGAYGIAVTPSGTVNGDKLVVAFNDDAANMGSIGVIDPVNTPGTRLNTVSAAGSNPMSVGNFMGPLLPITITASTAGTGCTITPSGAVPVNSYGRSFTIAGNVTDVSVDSVSQGANVTKYDFFNLPPTPTTHTIVATCVSATDTRPGINVVSKPGNACWVVSSAQTGLNQHNLSAKFTPSSQVTLTAYCDGMHTPDQWAGVCSGSAATPCIVNLAATGDVTVIVTGIDKLSGPVKNKRTGSYFGLLNDGCNDAGTVNGDTLMLASNNAVEGILNTSYGKGMLTIEGGYPTDYSFGTVPPRTYSTLSSLTITDTGFTVDQIVIQ